LLHLKTAGTSYLEALRVVARYDPSLFRLVLALARSRYLRDRASYHVSADLRRVPEPKAIQDARLESLLDSFDAREVLHVTFGSALETYKTSILKLLRRQEQAYGEALERHFVRHLEPLVRQPLAAGAR